jgi:hypothetical protein
MGGGFALLLASGPPPSAGATLPAGGQEFAISGSVGNLTPGVPAGVHLAVHNPFNVPISLQWLKVTVSPTPTVPSVPARCPATELNLVLVAGTPFRGTPPSAKVTFPAPQPVIPAGGSSTVASVSILLNRSAGNNCQHVVFPFNYLSEAFSAAPPTTTPPTTSPPTTAPPTTSPPTTSPPTTGPPSTTPPTVPPTHTGESFSSWVYWLLVAVTGAGALGLLVLGGRARRRAKGVRA